MSRRLLPVAVALLLVTSGCMGLITGETVAFDASPATVSDSTLDSTGYELRNASQRNITRTVSVAGQERTIRLTNEWRQYSRSGTILGIEVGELSRFVVLSTPTAEVAGQPVDVRVHVASFTHEGDVIVAIGVHPERLDETDNIDDLLSGLQHSGD